MDINHSYMKYMKYKHKYLEIKNNLIGGNDIPEDIYDSIDINKLRNDTNYEEYSKIAKIMTDKIPIVNENYLKDYRLISNTGQNNCGIYISDKNLSKLIKCTSRRNEMLVYLTIQKMIKKGKLPSDIIPKLYDIRKKLDDDNVSFFITMSRKTGSVSDYIFETYIPKKLKKKFGENILKIYNVMLPRTIDEGFSALSNFDIPLIAFIEFNDDELLYVSELLKKFNYKNNKNEYSLLELIYAIYDDKNNVLSNKLNTALKSIILTFNELYKNNKKSEKEYLSEIKINSWRINDDWPIYIKDFKNKLETIKKIFGNIEDISNYLEYDKFIKTELSNDLRNKLVTVREQIFYIDELLLQVCGLYQPDRKIDNWLVEVSSTPKKHFNVKSENAKFDENEYVYVKIGDPEQMIFVKPEEIGEYTIKIEKNYFELGSKLGQYPFEYLGQKKISGDFFKVFLQNTLHINKNIIEILSNDFRLINLINESTKRNIN